MHDEGQTEVQDNLDVIQLLKGYFASSFIKSDSKHKNNCRMSD